MSLLLRSDTRVMRDDMHSNIFLSKIYQLYNELSDLGKVVSTER